MAKKLEAKLVRDFLVEELQKRGWSFVENENLARESVSEPLLLQNLQESLERLNKDIEITEEEIKKVIQEIKLLPSNHEGTKKLLRFLKYGVPVKFEKERVVKYVNLIDYESPPNNEFILSREVTYKGRDLIRVDIILYVNGIPLVDIECKNPTSPEKTWEDGFTQIKEYEQKAPELYKYVQIGISAIENVRYFPIVPWLAREEVAVYRWEENNLAEQEAILEFLRPERLIDFLRNFVFIREERGKVTKVLARYMQYRTANKICERVVNNLEGKEDKNKGLIWHWQGSGKTLSMIFAGHKLYFDKHLENPTMFFIIDREDLERQLNEEFNSLDLNFTAEKIASVRHLQQVIKADNYRGKRGAFITLIHKFRPDEQFIPKEFIKEAETETIASRKNIVAFLDEVHRSQYGLLAAQMNRILKNAFFFGFTGTPISEDERDTYQSFGYPLKEERYLDRYFVDDSLRDGFTVPLVYQPRKEKLHLKREDLEKFLESDIEDISDIDTQRISREVSRQLTAVKVILENEKRITQKAEDIASHFKENVDGKFKALVVAGSRKACVLYKKHLDKQLPENDSEVVMTFNMDDPKEIKEYHQEWQKRHSGLADDNAIRRKLVENFLNQETPKILIVTDMLLTGFDAPILQVMYLDKLMKKHKLLQAIARTNRPYEGFKEAGLIIDYVGILKELKKAYTMYFDEREIGSVLYNFDFLLDRFKQLIKEVERIFAGIPYKFERQVFLRAVERLRDEENEQNFTVKFWELRKIFEMLGSYEGKLDYLEKYKWLTAVYAYYNRLKTDTEDQEKIRKYFARTIKAVHESLEVQKATRPLPTFNFNLDYFQKVAQSSAGKEEKAINILFALERFVLVEQDRNPVYRSVADKAEELVRKWREKRIDYEQLSEEEKKILSLIEKKQEEKESLGLSDFEYGIYEVLNSSLKGKNGVDLVTLTKDFIKTLEGELIENWIENPVLRQNVFRKSREFARRLKVEHDLPLETMEELYKKLIDAVTRYGLTGYESN